MSDGVPFVTDDEAARRLRAAAAKLKAVATELVEVAHLLDPQPTEESP